MDLDIKAIRHVAELAELSLTEEEETRLASEMGRILAYFVELDALDTTDVPPSDDVAGAAPTHSGAGWREDTAKAGLTHDDALAGAPHADHGGFAVPTFVE